MMNRDPVPSAQTLCGGEAGHSSEGVRPKSRTVDKALETWARS